MLQMSSGQRKKKASMTTGAFSRNVDKLFSELKLVPDNLAFIYYYDVHCNSIEASRFQLDDVSWHIGLLMKAGLQVKAEC